MPRKSTVSARRRICFVTGTRAEFGLMRSALEAIADHPSLELQLIVTGMHLDHSRGRGLADIRAQGWKVDAVVPWAKGDGSQTAGAVATGTASAAMARTLLRLKTDVVLVTGDRVEAFAAATAGHLSGRLVAHVHGGDRALGLIDDSLRHAITKLSHVHFPATAASAERIRRLGEDPWRIFRVGSPGLDDVKATAAAWSMVGTEFTGLRRQQYAVLLLHPQSPDAGRERENAELVRHCVDACRFGHTVIVYPNNDPGSAGIAACWNNLPPGEPYFIRRDIPRPLFLGLMRDAAVLVGNSSSGIIEAASFGTPVLDVGDRQMGRERGDNVAHAPMRRAPIIRELRKIRGRGAPLRYRLINIYGRGGAGRRIAAALADVKIERLRRKLIAY